MQSNLHGNLRASVLAKSLQTFCLDFCVDVRLQGGKNLFEAQDTQVSL